jgi:hypothetical protein
MKVRGRLPLSQILPIVLALALGMLAPLAHASAPDPSWIAGIYDGADYDDIVVLVTGAAGALSPLQAADLEPILRVVGPLAQLPARAIASLPASASRPRAPPAS